MTMIKPVFICSGNICRSPMAERLLMARARERGMRAMAISMGTLNLQGRSAARGAVEALQEIGIDLSGHMSQGLSPGLLRMATHILVMEQAHADAIHRLDPGLSERVALLGRYDGGNDEIDDPVGQPVEAFRICRDRLDACISAFLDSVTIA